MHYQTLHFIKADITDTIALKELFETHKFNCVIHLAAQAGIRFSFKHPESYVQVNIVGTFNIFEMCKKHAVKHTLFASSSSVYGKSDKEIFSTYDNCERPTNMYAASKKSNELMAHSYAELYQMKMSALRFFTVYGPWGRPDMAPIIFADAIVQNKPIKLFNEGNMYRDFTYVDDIIDAITALVQTPPKTNYNLYNIGNSKPIYLKKFVTLLEKELKKEAIIEYLPLQAGESLHTCADISVLKKHINFSPNYNIEEGIKLFVQWYVSYYGK